jgi:two-component system, cell cycle sensor histidine kinase and response regulator CckA
VVVTEALFAEKRQQRVARGAAAIAGVIALLSLGGWSFGVTWLTGILPGLPAVKAITAGSLGLLALALVAVASTRRTLRIVGLLLCVPVAVAAALALSAWMGGPGGFLDELLFDDPVASVAPGRMAPMTAVALLLLCGALSTQPTHSRRGPHAGRAASLLCVLAAIPSVLALVGLIFGAGPLYEPLALRGMSPGTAVAVISLAVGIGTLALPPSTRALLSSPGPGGVLIRRTLPVALVALLGIGFVQLTGRRMGWYGMGMGIALMVVLSGAVLILLLYTTAKQLERQHASISSQLFTERLYQEMLDQSPAAIFVKGPDGRYLVANSVCADILGWPREQVIGATDHDLLPREAADELVASDVKVRQTQEPFEVEELIMTSAGPRYFLTTKFPIEIAGRDELFVGGIAPDVTERQELERRLAQVARLETVGELAGGVAHDFNNLLTVITGMTELALQDLGDHPARAALDHSVAAAGRAADLSRDLLTFARRDAVPVAGAASPNEVAEQLQKLLHPLLGAGIELRFELGHDVGDVGLTATRLEQVLMNLALNARDAMPDGGALSIATRSVEIDAGSARRLPMVHPGQHVSVTVTDTGDGMTPEVRDRALEPFFTTKASGQGTGLGLASTYGLVTQAGGTIMLDSSPGSGTTVTVLLPTVTQPAPEAIDEETGPVPWVSGQGRHVLVVEDEPAVREVLQRQLEAVGFVVTAAEGAAEAAELVPGMDRPDLVVCDVVLRDGVGPHIVEGLQRRWSELAVLYVSGYADRSSRRLAPDDRLLHKPFSAAGLYRAVAATLESRPAEQPR